MERDASVSLSRGNVIETHSDHVPSDLEREIIPMCKHFGMAIAPWDAIGGGKFQTKKQLEERKKNNEGLRSIFGSEQSANEEKMSEALEKVANEHNIESPTAVALAYVRHDPETTSDCTGGPS